MLNCIEWQGSVRHLGDRDANKWQVESISEKALAFEALGNLALFRDDFDKEGKFGT